MAFKKAIVISWAFPLHTATKLFWNIWKVTYSTRLVELFPFLLMFGVAIVDSTRLIHVLLFLFIPWVLPRRQLTVHWQTTMLQLHRDSSFTPPESQNCQVGTCMLLSNPVNGDCPCWFNVFFISSTFHSISSSTLFTLTMNCMTFSWKSFKMECLQLNTEQKCNTPTSKQKWTAREGKKNISHLYKMFSLSYLIFFNTAPCPYRGWVIWHPTGHRSEWDAPSSIQNRNAWESKKKEVLPASHLWSSMCSLS